MSKPEDELEFINVVDHGASSQSASLTRDGGGGGRGAGGQGGAGGGFAGGHLGFIRQSRNKMTAFFHYIFKFLALFFYVMGGFKFVSSSSILTYIICILMLAFDFWTVKNVSGRLMVRALSFCYFVCVSLCVAGGGVFLLCQRLSTLPGGGQTNLRLFRVHKQIYFYFFQAGFACFPPGHSFLFSLATPRAVVANIKNDNSAYLSLSLSLSLFTVLLVRCNACRCCSFVHPVS